MTQQKNEHTVNCGSIEVLKKVFKGKHEPLETKTINLYKIHFVAYQNRIPELSNFLTIDELDRANRYHQTKDKNRFIIGRAFLKLILRELTGLDAREINFKYEKNKKPYLPDMSHMFFNVSHSGDYGIIGISNVFKIGVDIEKLDLNYNFSEILPTVFCAKEIQYIDEELDSSKIFYTLWTRKEALVKAMGKGIDDDFPNITVLDGTNQLKSSHSKNTGNWQVFSLDISEEYLAAVAINKISEKPPKVQLYELPKNIDEVFEL
jgi:4'-phosphopantetheinyl transferase